METVDISDRKLGCLLFSRESKAITSKKQRIRTTVRNEGQEEEVSGPRRPQQSRLMMLLVLHSSTINQVGD